jgi:phage-related baseplate assembly protein
LVDNIDFSDNRLPVVPVATNANGSPTFYGVKAYGTVVSGLLLTETVNVGNFQKFARISLSSQNVSEIISVFDSDGNEYFEVDYLAQDIVYREISNTNFKNDNVPSIIKPHLVTRKFTVETSNNNTILQFGSGKASDTNIVADPQSVAINVHGKTYTTSRSFDPTRLSQNESLGIVPENTTLTVTLRATNPGSSNLSVGQLNQATNVLLDFTDRTVLSDSVIDGIRTSVEVNNEQPITGDVSNATSDEIKQRIFDTFPTQNRAVTQADYENLAYRMHSKFGSVKRVSVQRDPDSQKRNLNMYVISEDSFGKLQKTNSTIKRNLKIWLNEYRMINDTIDILDPYILNFGIEFSIKTTPGADKRTTISRCVAALAQKFNNNYYIGESIVISDIYSTLNATTGVQDVIKARVVNKTGTSYSSSTIDINSNLSPDGNQLMIPKNAIVEFKFPETDFVGKAK